MDKKDATGLDFVANSFLLSLCFAHGKCVQIPLGTAEELLRRWPQDSCGIGYLSFIPCERCIDGPDSKIETRRSLWLGDLQQWRTCGTALVASSGAATWWATWANTGDQENFEQQIFRFFQILWATKSWYLCSPLTAFFFFSLSVSSNRLTEHIQQLQANSGTTISAGLQAAVQISGEDMCSGRYRRLLFLTDMDDMRPGQLDHMVATQSERGLYVSFVGIGMNFKAGLAEQVSKHKGSNYFCITKEDELHKTIVDNFDWNFFPAAFNVAVTEQSDILELESVYGTPYDTQDEVLEAEWTPDTHRFYPQNFKSTVSCFLLCVQRIIPLPMPALQSIFSFLSSGVRSVIRVDTVFPSGIQSDGAVDGGLILLKLRGGHGMGGQVRLTLRYEAGDVWHRLTIAAIGLIKLQDLLQYMCILIIVFLVRISLTSYTWQTLISNARLEETSAAVKMSRFPCFATKRRRSPRHPRPFKREWRFNGTWKLVESALKAICERQIMYNRL